MKIALRSARRMEESRLKVPQASVLGPGALHFDRGMELWVAGMTAGPGVSDTFLAAYAIGSRATHFANDEDVAWLPGMTRLNSRLEGER